MGGLGFRVWGLGLGKRASMATAVDFLIQATLLILIVHEPRQP